MAAKVILAVVRFLRMATSGLGTYWHGWLFGAVVVLPVILGILLILSGLPGDLAVIGVGIVMVLAPLLGWRIYADRAEKRNGSSER